MLKDMKLATKIAAGFAILLVIACLLGGLAVFNMNTAKTGANKLAYEYVPEVKLANEVERHSLLTMYNIRGYGLTENEQYLNNGLAELLEVEKSLQGCQELAEKSENLVKLKDEVTACTANVKLYKNLLDETKQTFVGLNDARNGLDAGAAEYMTACATFLDSQNKQMVEDIKAGKTPEQLEERLTKITVVNDIIDIGNETRVATFKSQALREPQFIKDALANFEIMDKKFKELEAITRLEVDLKQIEKTQHAANTYASSMKKLLTSWEKLNELGKKRDDAGQVVLDGAQATATAGITHTENIANETASNLGTSSNVMLAGLGFAVVLGTTLAIFITMSIVKPIRRIINELTEGSEQVSSAASQVSSASQSLAEGATEQAAGLEETSSSLEEMSSMTKQNADNANQANALSSQTSQSAQQGTEAMGRMNTAISDIQKSSEETSKIIKVIDEIAFQTNLLALNAAVEAARAGEAGKGFAVVAEEVRNLAMRSAEAAKNTTALIDQSVKNSQNGVEVAGEVNKKLEEITSNVTKSSELIAEIAAASNEQAQGIEQVNQAVTQMDKVTQSNAANAEESASAAEELTSQASSVNEIVGQLIAMVGGNNSGASRATVKSARKVKTSSPDIFHDIANSKGSAKQAEDVIPMNDKEFSDFS